MGWVRAAPAKTAGPDGEGIVAAPGAALVGSGGAGYPGRGLPAEYGEPPVSV